MIFVNKVREYRDANDERGLIVEKAVNYCIENHILENFFKERKEEVIKYMTIDMTFEAREKIFRKEEREEGKLLAVIDFVKDGLCSVEEGARRVGMSVDAFEARMQSDRN